MSSYPWVNDSGSLTSPTTVTNCLAITSPRGLVLYLNGGSADSSYNIYSHSYPLYIVNDNYGSVSASPCLANSRILFDSSLSFIELYTEDNNSYNGHGAVTSITINGIYGSTPGSGNIITLRADWSTTIPTTGVIAEFDGSSQKISLTAANGLWLNGTQFTTGGIQSLQSGSGINAYQVSSNPNVWQIDNTGGGGGGSVTDVQAGTGISINSTGSGGTGSITVSLSPSDVVYWSQLNNANITYNYLGSSNYQFGLTDNGNGGGSGNAQYSTTFNINSNYNGILSASISPCLYIGDTYNNRYTLLTNVNPVSEPSVSSYTTLATFGTDMHLYADKQQTGPYGYGTMYLYATSIVPGNAQPPNYSYPTLGTTSLYWGSVNAGSFNTISDIKLKENIAPLDTDYSLSLIKKVNPVSYKLKNDNKNKKHFGVIAQEIKEIIGDENLALHINEETQAVSYIEFISPLIKSVQFLLQKVENLELQIKELQK
jgi:hypothetical protein